MIYILEDDESIRELVAYTLNGSGMEAVGFETPEAFWAGMAEKKPELLILDIMLPQEDGLSILRRLRAAEATASMPIIMLTAKDTEYDKVMGLDGGADDYVTKPFSMLELVSRIRALLRRTDDDKGESAIAYGGLELYPSKHRVVSGGCIVDLTLKEYELLKFMIENRGTVYSRDTLLNRIWGYSFDGESRTVDVHIRTLRKKLGPCGEYVETVRGVGYRFAEGET